MKENLDLNLVCYFVGEGFDAPAFYEWSEMIVEVMKEYIKANPDDSAEDIVLCWKAFSRNYDEPLFLTKDEFESRTAGKTRRRAAKTGRAIKTGTGETLYLNTSWPDSNIHALADYALSIGLPIEAVEPDL